MAPKTDSAERERLRKPWSWLSARLYATLAWIIFASVLIVFALSTALPCDGELLRALWLPKHRHGRPISRLRWMRARRIAKNLALFFFRRMHVPLNIQGLERLPTSPHILLLNHSSFLDAIVLTASLPADPGYTFTTRQEFRAQSMLCPLLRRVHTLVLSSPGKPHGANIHIMVDALSRGENLITFPEGRFTSEPGLLPFHTGAFVAATRAKASITIAVIRGARVALPLGSWSLRQASITVEIGPSFACDTDSVCAIEALSMASRTAMLRMCGESC